MTGDDGLPRSLFWDRDGQPISREQWVGLRESAVYHRVALTTFGEPPLVSVSTVWIGIDYGFGETERPLVFETMVFGGPLDGERVRTADVHDANTAHDAYVTLVRAELDVDA